jgi:hypothetical protein
MRKMSNEFLRGLGVGVIVTAAVFYMVIVMNGLN